MEQGQNSELNLCLSQRSDSEVARELELELNTVESDPIAMPADQWQCEACTMFNPQTEIACTMCFTSRMGVKDVPVTWEWQAEGDTWIPYDLPTCVQLEEAFNQKLERVSLSSGFFADQPGVYEITFEWEGRPNLLPNRKYRFGRRQSFCLELQCWQVMPCLLHQVVNLGPESGKCLKIKQYNNDSGNVRKVRRIGDDDCKIFVSIDKQSNLQKDDKCGVCQEAFYEDEDVGQVCEQDVVRLAKCTNHYFHRDCISQWVKLKHTCPFCKTPI